MSVVNLMRVAKREQSFIIDNIKQEKERQHHVVSTHSSVRAYINTLVLYVYVVAGRS